MLTGWQIREARRLLQWSRVRFGEQTSLAQGSVAAIESSDGPAWLMEEQEAAIRLACEGAGIRFEVDAEGKPSAVLSRVEP